ncbi:MAG: succinic semialdehyde dehydrogenase [Actinomycetota bacterium]
MGPAPGGRSRLLAPAALARLASDVPTGAARPTLASHAPFDGRLVGEVPACTAGDVGRAAARARQAQARWAATPVADRVRVAERYHELVLARQDDLLDLVQLETGKDRRSAFEEVADVAGTARYYASLAAEALAPARRKGALPGLTATTEHRHPVGLAGVISPFNYPLTLAVSDALPALLAGNAVLLKPDPQTPFTALAAARLLAAAGLPRGLLTVLTGEAEVVGPALVEAVDHVTFTGSTATGRHVAEHCARRLIGFSGELGGKNPLLVLADADLDAAAAGAVRAAFANTGQLCIAMERLYVEDAVYDAFLARFLAHVGRLRLGAGFGWDVDVGSLSRPAQLATVAAHVDDAVAKGARVRAGGRARPDLGPLFYEPTVLEGVTEDMAVAHEETFGPVVSVERVADAEEALRRANASPFGLNASLWTSPARGRRLATRIETGSVNVNDAYAPAWGSIDAPMGGMKDSGLGRRHGRAGLLRYTEAQTVALQRLAPIAPPPGVPAERYPALLTTALRLLQRLPGVR